MYGFLQLKRFFLFYFILYPVSNFWYTFPFFFFFLHFGDIFWGYCWWQRAVRLVLSEIFDLKVSLFVCVSSLLLTLTQTHTSFHCSSSHLTPGIKDVKCHKEYNKWAFLMGFTVHAERRWALNTPVLDLYYEYTQHAHSLEIFWGAVVLRQSLQRWEHHWCIHGQAWAYDFQFIYNFQLSRKEVQRRRQADLKKKIIL